MDSGVPFHVQVAKQAGATRAEVLSAILLGLPATGNAVTQSLPTALAAYDAAPVGVVPCDRTQTPPGDSPVSERKVSP